MKKMINYFYNLYPTKIYDINSETFFYDGNDKYYIKVYKNNKTDNCKKIVELLNEKHIKINEIVKNKNNSYISEYNKKEYVLIKVNDIEDVDINIKDIINYNIVIENSVNKSLFVNEIDEMKMEIDNYEKLISGYNREYSLVQQICNYYIGLAENAVSYLNDSIKELDNKEYSLSHINIDSMKNKILIDITNISYNYRLKDVSSYFRIKLINKESIEEEFEYIVSKYEFNEFDYRFLYSEIVYPKYFFNIINKIFNEKYKENVLNDLINSINENEIKLNNLFLLINNYCKIPSIWWLNDKNETNL